MHLSRIYGAVHRYAGLTAGAFLCLLGLSGSILVFRPELERLTKPELFYVEPTGTAATLQEMSEIAAQSVSPLELYRVRLAAEPSDSYEFYLGTGGKLTTRVYIDPFRQRVLGKRTADSDFFLWLQALHFDLLMAETGRQINGAIAVALLFLGLTGSAMWLASKANAAARLWPRWNVRSARRNWGLHVAFGFWGLPFVLLMGSTALYFAFHDPVANFVYAVTRTAPRPALRKVDSLPPALPLDLLLQRARSLEPDGHFTLIRLPRTKGQAVTFNYALAGDWSDLGANGIHFDPNSGTLLRIDRIRELPLGPRIVAAFVPLHFGIFGGTATRVLWALAGVLPLVLFTTGLAMWRRRGKRRRAPGAASPDQRQAESVMEVHNS